MKKISEQFKFYLQRKASYALRKRQKQTIIQARKKRALAKPKYNTTARPTIKINAPENFVLEYAKDDCKLGYPQNRLNLLTFISKIKHSLSLGKKVQISFKDTKWLAPSGTIIFVAELEKILDKYAGKVTCDYPNDDVVEQLFQHIGLLERLGLTPRKTITAENVRHWNYVHGTTVDTTAFKSLFTRYATEISEDVRSGLFDSMSEAVTNSFQHAYPCSHKNKCDCEKSWWMFAKQTDHVLYVVMYDMGIGIPTSLEMKPELKEWLSTPYRRYKKRHDTVLLDIAVGSNRTSTRLPHRGKGLPEMLEFVKYGHIGEFTIFSRAGAFTYDAEDRSEKGRDFKVPISGTIIQWEVPLTSKT